MQAAVAGKLRAAKDLAQAVDFGLRLAHEEDLLTATGVVEFLANFLDVAAEALDRLDRQPARCFQRAGGNGRGRDGWKLIARRITSATLWNPAGGPGVRGIDGLRFPNLPVP